MTFSFLHDKMNVERKIYMEKIIKSGYKARLFATPRQEQQFKNNMQLAMSTYNHAWGYNLAEAVESKRKEKEYEATLQGSKKEIEDLIKEWRNEHGVLSVLTPQDKIGKSFKKYIKTSEYYNELLKRDGVAETTISLTLYYNYQNAIKKFRENLIPNTERVKRKAKRKPNWNPKFPQDYGFPQKKTSEDSYYTIIYRDKIDYDNNKVCLPCGIGWVKVSSNQPLPILNKKAQYVVISTDGQHFYISFPIDIEVENFKTPKTDVIGIDLGQKEVAILSDGTHVPNVTKTKKYIKLLNKIKKLSRKKCWLVEHSPKSWNIEDKKEKWKQANSNQMKKLDKMIRNCYIKLNNYKNNYNHEMAKEIVSKNPRGIIFEKLNIQGMMKNKHLSGVLQQTGMYSFKQTVIWHATKHGIPVKEADMWYASTQNCSVCGTKNIDMKGLNKLGKRTFKCPNCGAVIQRDENSALNLKSLYDSIPEVINEKEETTKKKKSKKAS